MSGIYDRTGTGYNIALQPMNAAGVQGNLETDLCRFTWRVQNFSSFKSRISSPIYSINDSKWSLVLYPCGQNQSTQDFVAIFLHLQSSAKPHSDEFQVFYELTMKKGTGVTLSQQCSTHKFSHQTRINGWQKFIRRDVLQGKSTDQESLEDTLTITCKIHMNAFSNTSVNLEKNILQNYESLFFNENFCDLTIQIAGKKMKAHKSILSARSKVFLAMFRNNMTEKNTSTVHVKDVSYNVMKDILLFIYSGKVNDLKTNAKSLLPPAEKYGITDLKELCEQSISENIKIEDASETLITADLYQCSLLKAKIIDFIIKNMKKVNQTSGFKELITSHPLLIQEIFNKLSEK